MGEIERADFLRGGLAALFIANATGCAPDAPESIRPSPAAARQALVFFSQDEANTVDAMAERIFPADPKFPGAIDLGVTHYLDRRLAGGYGYGEKQYKQAPFLKPPMPGFGWQVPELPREAYRDAIAAIDAYAQNQHGMRFKDLAPEMQDAVLSDVEDGKPATFTILEPKDFFKLFLMHVTEGAFADPLYGGNANVASWKMIGFPGDPMAYGDQYEKYIDRYGVAYDVEPKPLQ